MLLIFYLFFISLYRKRKRIPRLLTSSPFMKMQDIFDEQKILLDVYNSQNNLFEKFTFILSISINFHN